MTVRKRRKNKTRRKDGKNGQKKRAPTGGARGGPRNGRRGWRVIQRGLTKETRTKPNGEVY